MGLYAHDLAKPNQNCYKSKDMVNKIGVPVYWFEKTTQWMKGTRAIKVPISPPKSGELAASWGK